MENNRITAEEIREEYENYGSKFIFVIDNGAALYMEGSNDEYDERYCYNPRKVVYAAVIPGEYEETAKIINNAIEQAGY